MAEVYRELMFSLDRTTGLLRDVRYVASPNCDARPSDCGPELIVIHGISLPPADEHPYFAEIAGLEVSTHFLIRRDGSVTQYVPVDRRAWHAGQSCFEGRERCNDFSIGIELEGEDSTPYAAAQYDALADLIEALRFGIESLRHAPVVGHSDIAPGRKTDPGEAFDWQYLTDLLNSRSHQTDKGTV